MPSKYEAAFQSAIIDRERQICIDLLRQTPDLTLGDIHKLSRGSLARIFDAISVDELIAGSASGAPGVPKAKVGRPRGRRPAIQQPLVSDSAPAPEPVAAAAAPGVVNTRTPAGRLGYDNAILTALTDIGAPVGVAKLMARAGGSNLQARAALNRLINAGRVAWSGKARGTRYSLA